MSNNDTNTTCKYSIDAYLKVRKDTAVVVSAPEGTFKNGQVFLDENGREYRIISVAMCCGPNVDRSKSSILIEGEFSSQYIYMSDSE